MAKSELRATLLHGLSDPNRLRIVEALRDAQVITAADRVLAQVGETVGACPRYGRGR